VRQKRVFKIALAALAIMLAILPFVVSINDILTRAVENFGWYMWIQKKIVPWEVRLVGVMVSPLGIDFVAHPEGFTANGTYAKLCKSGYDNCCDARSQMLSQVPIIISYLGKRRSRSFCE